jgi:transposase-like protein
MAGRPSKYNPEFHPKLVEAYCLAGKTDEEMSSYLGIAVSTFYEWVKKYPAFSEALKGKIEPDDAVERSLFERATGYSHKAVKIFNNQGEIVTHEYVEHYPPDPTSMIFWLKNRRRDKWRDRPDESASNETTLNIRLQTKVDDSNIEIYVPDKKTE